MHYPFTNSEVMMDEHFAENQLRKDDYFAGSEVPVGDYFMVCPHEWLFRRYSDYRGGSFWEQ